MSHTNPKMESNVCQFFASFAEVNKIPKTCSNLRTSDEHKSTLDLIRALRSADQFDDKFELLKRKTILKSLNKLFNEWINKTTSVYLPQEQAATIKGHVRPFGSYRLGVHQKDADIDALCMGPGLITRHSFFTDFVKTLKEDPAITECLSIPDAYVPLIKMKYSGIDVDLLFARLSLPTVLEDINICDDQVLQNMDQKCVRSLNGCRVTDTILACVTNVGAFQLALRTIKLWAKRSNIYSNALGYLGGVSWAILMARICQLYPKASAAMLVERFFMVWSEYSFGPTQPVLLRPLGNQSVWTPKPNDPHSLMPIITPTYPEQNTTFNVTKSSLMIIDVELFRGRAVMEARQRGTATWEDLFRQNDFHAKYRTFVTVIASCDTIEAHSIWKGIVESQIRHLVPELEMISDQVNVQTNSVSVGPTKTMWVLGISKENEACLDISEANTSFKMKVFSFLDRIGKRSVDMQLDVKSISRKQLFALLPKNVSRKRNLSRTNHCKYSKRSK